MSESQVLNVIQLWAAVAWADGVLAQAEADGLRRLIKNADLTVDERTAAARFIERPVSTPDKFLDALSPEARRGIYRAACRLALVDHALAPAERRVLDRLRLLLAIPDDIGREIEADVPGLG